MKRAMVCIGGLTLALTAWGCGESDCETFKDCCQALDGCASGEITADDAECRRAQDRLVQALAALGEPVPDACR